MNKALRPAIAALLAVGAAVAPAGCAKEAAKEAEGQASFAKVRPVSDNERARARQEVRKLWSQTKVTASVRALDPGASAPEFYRDLVVLTRHAHRLAGYGTAGIEEIDGRKVKVFADEPGSLFAGQYVANRLKAMGVEFVLTQDFPVPQPIATECSLTIAGQAHEQGFYAMRTNHLQAPCTPKEGLRADKLVYAGTGRLSEYRDAARDAVVVLEFAAGERWKDAFALGAKAVIFIGSDAAAPNTYHHVNFPANLPRFYATADLAQKAGLTALKAAPTRSRDVAVEVRAASRWELREGRNVLAVIRGTDPRFPKDAKDTDPSAEAIVLAAPLDSLSEVPLLSPGARQAGNCAALLSLAAGLQKAPPRRDVILCFLDGDACDHAGARAMYGALYRHKARGKAAKPLANRLWMFQDAQERIRGIEKVLDMGNVFSDRAKDADSHNDAVLTMQVEAKGMHGSERDRLQLLRSGRHRGYVEYQRLGGKKRHLLREINKARKKRDQPPLAAAPAVPGESPRAAELRRQIDRDDRRIQAGEDEVIIWSDLRRALQDRRYPDPAEAEDPKERKRVERVAEKYREVLKQLEGLNRQRVAELERLVGYTREGHALVQLFGEERNHIVLHFLLNLGDTSGRWAFVHGHDSQLVHASKDGLGRYAKMFQAIREVARAGREKAPGRLSLFEMRTVDGLHNMRMFAPGLFASSGSVAGTFGVANLSLMTPMDRRVRDGQPGDVVTRAGPAGAVRVLRTENTLRALGQVAPFLRSLADAEGMSLRSGISPQPIYAEVTYGKGGSSGASALMLSGASPMPDRPARGGFAAVMRAGTKLWEGGRVDLVPPGFQPFSLAEVKTNGRFELPALSRSYHVGNTVVAALFDDRGLIRYINNEQKVRFNLPLDKAGCILFHATSMTAVGIGYDRGATATKALRAASTAPLNAKYSLLCEGGNVLTVYCRRATEKLKLFNSEGIVLLGNSETNPIVGEGVAVDPYVHPPTVELTAGDLQTLNTGRLKVLSDNRILEPSLQQLHVDSGDVRDRARSLPPQRVEARTGGQAAAAAIGRRPYKALLEVFNDLVVAVVLLLLLSIPFAYSIERLLVGSPHIYRQIGWFVLFFLMTFAVLYAVNPAFRIAATPIVIFLAFAIILLSAVVIAIMTRKLQAEVRRMQGLSTTVHSSDVSRLGTMMAAVSMGISTMRRRPVRTILTAVTVVLLTFTILTFASFTSSWGNRRTSIGPMSGPTRLLVRHPFWTRIREDVPEMLEGFLADRATVVPRYWVAQSAEDVQAYKQANRVKQILLGDAEGERIVPVQALVGMDVRDVEQAAELADVLGGKGQALRGDGVFLTEAVAGPQGLNVAVGDTVCVDGVACTFAGPIDRRKITRYKLLEGSSMLPVDYEATSGGGGEVQTVQTTSIEDLPEMESAQFEHFSSDRIAIIPAALARRLGGRVATITIYPREEANVERMAQRVATVTHLPTYVGSGGGVTRLFFTSLTAASGWRDLIIPVVLGGLIIFATMLGSVSDREKEIYAFSALGLAPPHVAGLFFAEAAVYAVVGGMGGYMLGQVVARGLSFVSETFGILSVPTMNYSSTNAIATVMVVMCTVMVSTIYPAIKASGSANPGIQRSWRIGRPASADLYDIVFPFTVSAYDITGVVSFLNEHFQNYTDSTLGVFATSSSRVFRKPDNMLGIEADVALAPFDLGVAQKFALMAQPGEIEGIEEIRVLLRRTAGTRGDWQRANRVFVHELRKQLLIWRSIDPKVMEQYRQRTLQEFQGLPVLDVRAETFGEHA